MARRLAPARAEGKSSLEVKGWIWASQNRGIIGLFACLDWEEDLQWVESRLKSKPDGKSSR